MCRAISAVVKKIHVALEHSPASMWTTSSFHRDGTIEEGQTWNLLGLLANNHVVALSNNTEGRSVPGGGEAGAFPASSKAICRRLWSARGLPPLWIFRQLVCSVILGTMFAKLTLRMS